jgi:hypothetical protein
MLRVAGWTVGLFGAGAAISRIFTSPWAEPLVLLALGTAFLLLSRRTGRPRRAVVARLRRASAPAAPAAVRGPVPAPLPTSEPAPVPVEQSA